MDTLLQDLRFAWHNLRRTPAFPLAAVATLALGIGATTAIFSTVNAVLLRPLPYPRPQDLYSLRTVLTDGRVTTGLLSPAELARLNNPDLSIERVAGLSPRDVTLLRDDDSAEHTQAYNVSDGFFELFGLPMTLGTSTLDPEAGNGPPVVVVSYEIWRDRYPGDMAVIGKPIHFAEGTATIVGVAPQGFDTPHGASFWFLTTPNPQRIDHNFEGFMRLRPGASVDRARSEMASVMAGLAREFPVADTSRAYTVQPLVESIVGKLGPILLLVLSATALLLVLACVNVTNLLLARGAARGREIAVRVALGAGRARIVRQLLTESIGLAAAGAGVGVAGAYLGIRVLLRIGASKFPRLESVPFDVHVLLFAVGALVTSGVLVGFAPALRLAATGVKTLMNERGRSSSGGRKTTRWLAAMTVAEIALAVVLVAGAGWLVRGFANLRTTDPGFVAEGRLLFDVALVGPKWRVGQAVIAAASSDLLDRLRGLHGVTAAGAASSFPLRGVGSNTLVVELHGEPAAPGREPSSMQRSASPGYFKAMGMTLLAGRDFNSDDRPGTVPVVVVTRTFVRRYLSGEDPLGRQFSYGYPKVDPGTESTIVGVVGDVAERSLDEVPEPAFYTSETQGTPRHYTVVVQNSLADETSLQSLIRGEVRTLDPHMAVDFEDASEVVGATTRRLQLGMTLMLLFGAAAIALAVVGIYGVIAYGVAERQVEMATRLALGATPGLIFRFVLKQGCGLTAAGGAIGLAMAYWSGRLVSNGLYEVPAADPLVLGAAVVLVVVLGVLATVIPAYLASHLDPARVLRAD
jgi:putative ABC transport system permease protein